MSDAQDPRHVQSFYRPNLDDWIDSLMYELICFKKCISVEDNGSESILREELKIFASQVVRASRDGCFPEIVQDEK